MFLSAFCMFCISHLLFRLSFQCLTDYKCRCPLFFHQIMTVVFHCLQPFLSHGFREWPFYFHFMKKIYLLLILLTPVCLHAQNRYDVLITEIMADPAPVVGLPNAEWIELKNVSSTAIQLQGWRIGDVTSLSGPMPAFTLQPDSFLIVCSSSAVAALSVWGSTISVTSFPSLDNDGDQIYLRAANGRIMHAVNYQSGWYRNELKKDGGWSLEMIDPRLPCTGSSNWIASSHASGGSPGKKNATDALLTDQTGPGLKSAYSTDSITIVLVFDEPVDSLLAAQPGNYTADGGINIVSAICLPPLFQQVQLKINPALLADKIYTITAANIKDCRGNSIGNRNKVRTGIPTDPVSGEWIINEILFNPKSNAYDYVEFLNHGNRILDASRLFIANRNSSGAISSIKMLSPVPFYVFPDEHLVATSDPVRLTQFYLVKNPDLVLPIDAPPTFPDDEGDVITLDAQGNILDEVHYKDDWHFKLIDNPEGVALERIDPAGPSNEPGNWHSAASTAGYGTPSYRNSQYKIQNSISANLSVSPSLFSPDNDGVDDITSISYEVAEPGYIASITVFDIAGRPVKFLARNVLLGISGSWNWDGLSDTDKKLPAGNYVVLAELFNGKGQVQRIKKMIVLAARMQ